MPLILHSGQANVTIPVVSTLQTPELISFASEANSARLEGGTSPSLVIDFSESISQTDKVQGRPLA